MILGADVEWNVGGVPILFVKQDIRPVWGRSPSSAIVGRGVVMMMGDETAAEYHVDFDEGILVRHGVELEDKGGRSVPVEWHL